MKLRTLALGAVLTLVLAAFAACDVTNDSDADSAGGGVQDTGSGTPNVDTNTSTPGFGCDADGYCNYAECGFPTAHPTDPDCNQAIDALGDKSSKDPSCNCNYWGGVCEAISKCSSAICLCDTDCTPPDGSLKGACVSDGHCDTYCEKDTDPDCAGASGNGKYCSAPSCNKKSGVCNAKSGTTSECADDPDCDGILLPCESDGYCDKACSAGADPDC